MDKKRAEGKHYFVYMTAAANKFLRIYYARVTEHLNLSNPPFNRYPARFRSALLCGDFFVLRFFTSKIFSIFFASTLDFYLQVFK